MCDTPFKTETETTDRINDIITFINMFDDMYRLLREQMVIQISKVSGLERNLIRARNVIDEEKKKRKMVEKERDECKAQLSKIYSALLKDNKNELAEETKEQLASHHLGRKSWGDPNQLSAIQEINTTGPILSDFSYLRSEDDLDSSRCLKNGKSWEKIKSNGENSQEAVPKERKSNSNKVVEIGAADTVRATTTSTMLKDGPITATSVIESVPKSTEKHQNGTQQNIPGRQGRTPTIDRNVFLKQHCLQQIAVVIPDTCIACEKKVRFGQTALRCKECKSFCHIECQNVVPLPCIPIVNTPNRKKATGTVSDYTPTMPPMVPSLVVDCTKEVEQRGLQELGVPGSEEEVKSSARMPPNPIGRIRRKREGRIFGTPPSCK